MKNANEAYVVLTEKQIVQKMAGYKSAYTKMVNAAKTTKERKALEANRDAYLSKIETEIRKENKKSIQRRAGHLSWITRKANQSANSATTQTVTEKKSKTTSKKVCRCTSCSTKH
jgi:hypothetical protein